MSSPVALPQLHRRFKPEAIYRASDERYSLLPFRFTRLPGERVLLVNQIGEWLAIPGPLLEPLIERHLPSSHPLFDDLVAKHFVLLDRYRAALDVLATGLRTRYQPLAEFTGLHLFVVTLRCDHSCPYCQVSRVSSDKDAFDMSEATAERAVDLMFRSPSRQLKVEFQGGESLLNLDRIRHIVELVERRNAVEHRQVQFVIATNLAQLSDEALDLSKKHGIFISTSLDGPAWLHNANRRRPGGDSHQRTVQGIERVRAALGEHGVAALMTTTMRSLDCPEAIVDEYVRMGFNSIFLRPLSPYGFAVKSAKAIGYPINEWNGFYERGLRHILALAKAGQPIREEYASIVLRKMLTPFPGRYVDLQSPAGMVLGAVVYNYDGDVYASDEARMLAETGDKTFRLGSVHTDSYESIFLGERLQQLLADTMTEATPLCADCAFEPFCGTDPTFHHATQRDAIGHRPTSAFCKRNMFVFRLLMQILLDEPENAAILRSWA